MIVLFLIFKLESVFWNTELCNKILSLLAALSELYKSGNMESLSHRKAYRDLNDFGGYGVIISRMLKVSQELCLVVKECGETLE